MANNQTTYFTRKSDTKTVAWDKHNVFLTDEFLFQLVDDGYEDVVILDVDRGRFSASVEEWLAADHSTTTVRHIAMSRMNRG